MEAKVILITPEIAKSIIVSNSHNRAISESKVDSYCNQIKEGKWKLTGQGISIANDGTLIDGQHRLRAIIKSGISVKMMIVTGVDYSTFDVYDTGKTRTSGDVLKISGIVNSTRIASIISVYLKFKNNSGGYQNIGLRNIPKYKVLDVYNDNSQLFQDIFSYADKYYRKLRIYNSSLIGGFISYLILEKKYSPYKVLSFFDQLYGFVESENISIDLLRDRLIKNALSLRKVSTTETTAFLIKAWNNFILQKQIKIYKYTPQTDEFPIIK